MFWGTQEERVQQLHEEALALLDRGDLVGARARAEELRAMRWSGAFEILALVCRAEGDLSAAVRVLEEGVALVPAAWPLRQLLGNLEDELGHRDVALAQYDAALACEGAWTSSIRYNRAVVRLRAGDPGGALADAESVLEDPSTPPFTLDALRIAIDALHALGRSEHARQLVEATRSSLAAGDTLGRAELAAFAALAAVRAGASREVVRAALDAAIEGGASRVEIIETLSLFRADATEGEGRVRFQVTIAAPALPGAPPGIGGYMRAMGVRARDEAHAHELARTFEPSASRAAITIEECRRLADDVGPAGVLSASGRIYFGADAPD